MKSKLNDDQLIQKFLEDYMQFNLIGLPSEAALALEYKFSDEFERKMRELIDGYDWKKKLKKSKENISFLNTRPRSTIKKRLIIIAIILAILTSIFSITAARETIWNFIITTYEKFSNISFTSPDPNTVMPDEETIKPEDLKLPPGFTEKDRFEFTVALKVVYATPDGREFMFDKVITEGTQMSINTEGVQTEEIAVRGKTGLYYANMGVEHLIWTEGRYVIQISGKITKEELLNLVK